MTPSENCPDCGGTGKGKKDNGFILGWMDTIEVPCHCTKEHDGDGPDD